MGLVSRIRQAGPLAIVAAAVAVAWIAGSMVWPVIAIAGISVLVASTWLVVSPDLKVFFGRGDPRPWLVRLREHRWPPVAVPFVGALPRVWAYVLLAVGWWLLLR